MKNIKKQKMTYYYLNGQIDYITTFINNNDWFIPLSFVLVILLAGLIG